MPRHDPWRSLPSQQFEEVLAEREKLWDQLKRDLTPIGPDEETSVADSASGDDPPSLPWLRLFFLRQNMERLALNWASNWTNVGRTLRGVPS